MHRRHVTLHKTLDSGVSRELRQTFSNGNWGTSESPRRPPSRIARALGTSKMYL